MTSICKQQEIIKIKFYWPYGDEKSIFDFLSNMIIDKKNDKKKIQLVMDENEADFNIILNLFSANQNVNFAKSILIEVSNNIPLKITDETKKMFLKYVPLNEMLNLGTYLSSFDFQKLNSFPISKSEKKLSCCISNNYVNFSETQLHDFLIYLQNKNYILDIYGESLFPLNIKEEIDKTDLGKGLIPYKYTLIYENKFEANVFSEKIFDAILAECFVFYYGCPNIENWINPDCFQRLELNNFENDLKIIKKTIEQKTWEKRIDIIKKEKSRIMKKFNLFSAVEKIIDEF